MIRRVRINERWMNKGKSKMKVLKSNWNEPEKVNDEKKRTFKEIQREKQERCTVASNMKRGENQKIVHFPRWVWLMERFSFSFLFFTNV